MGIQAACIRVQNQVNKHLEIRMTKWIYNRTDGRSVEPLS